MLYSHVNSSGFWFGLGIYEPSKLNIGKFRYKMIGIFIYSELEGFELREEGIDVCIEMVMLLRVVERV